MTAMIAGVPLLLGIGALVLRGRPKVEKKAPRPLILTESSAAPKVEAQGSGAEESANSGGDTEVLQVVLFDDPEVSGVVSEPVPILSSAPPETHDMVTSGGVEERGAAIAAEAQKTEHEPRSHGPISTAVEQIQEGDVGADAPAKDRGALSVRVVPYVVSAAPNVEVAPVFHGEGVRIAPMPARSVVRVRRADGTPLESPIELAADGTLTTPESEMLPDVEQWGDVHQERLDAFQVAKAAADAKDQQEREEEERRETAARALALVELEKQSSSASRWWNQLDEDAESDTARAALASSLSTVRMAWAQKVLLRAIREDASIKVRARAVGALVRAGFFEDPTPFNEIFEENNQMLTMAVREALTPHQDVPWVRNLFA